MHSTADRFNARCAQGGVTYIGLLILIAIMAVAASATIQVGAVNQRRAAEQELLFIGAQFVAALRSYSANTPAGQPRVPKELTDLLRDPRASGIRRHLRRIPVDPITSDTKWGVKRSPDGYIVGVHSLSESTPIKVGNFNAPFTHFEAATKYSEWVFGIIAAGSLTP